MNTVQLRWYRISITPIKGDKYETAVQAECYEKALCYAAEQAARMKFDPLNTVFNVSLFDRANAMVQS